jgi:hypothetical protein
MLPALCIVIPPTFSYHDLVPGWHDLSARSMSALPRENVLLLLLLQVKQ